MRKLFKKNRILIASSILAADFGNLNDEIASVENHVDMIHVDVMDGHFVSNITFGPPAISHMKCGKPMDVHLMIERPDLYIEEFAAAIQSAHGRRSDCYITVHAEACKHLHRVVEQIKHAGCRAAVALNPATPLYIIEPILSDFNMVLLMTVNPGFGGQKFITSVLPKIQELRVRAPKLHIQVDGGINDKTAKLAVHAGANVLVAGSYIFRAKSRKAAIESLR